MTQRILTFGYTTHKPAELLDVIQQIDAILVDIRYRPVSRNPHWTGSRLCQFLPEGRYIQMHALGNKNYNNGQAIELVNYEWGRDQLYKLPKTAILMCACKEYQFCHRKVVADLLQHDGFVVEELGLKAKMNDSN